MNTSERGAPPSRSPTGPAGPRGLEVVRGRQNPYQGWVSPAYLQKQAAPAVVSPASPDSLLTVVVPGTDKPSLSCAGGKVSLETSRGTVSFKVSGSDLS